MATSNSNTGQEWTQEEDNKLLELVLSGLSYEEISKTLGRSYMSVSNRTYVNIKRMIDDNNSKEFLCAKYHIKTEDYDNFLDKQKKKYENKREKNKNKNKKQENNTPVNPVNPVNNQNQEIIELLREIRDLLQIRRNKKIT